MSEAIAAIQALVNERDQCRDRINQINNELQTIRGAIDARSAGQLRRARAEKVAPADTTEPPQSTS